MIFWLSCYAVGITALGCWALFGRDEEARRLAELVEDGYCVERGKWHLYRAGNDYVILKFDNSADPVYGSERRFGSVGKAVKAFLKRT